MGVQVPLRAPSRLTIIIFAAAYVHWRVSRWHLWWHSGIGQPPPGTNLLRCDRETQLDAGSALVGLRVKCEASSVGLSNLLGEDEADSGTIWLGGIEGDEEIGKVRDALSVVLDADEGGCGSGAPA